MTDPVASSCPSDDRLARALAEEDDALGGHVEGCARCRCRLSALATGDGAALVRELRELSAAGSPIALGLPRIDGLELLRELHRGGQGVVYEARAVATDERVAVKTLLAGRLATVRDLRRFEREVEVVAGLDHPHVVRPLGSGRTEDGTPCYWMELVDGVPLDRYVEAREERGRPLTRDERLALFLAVGEGVEHAHRRGAIHRDLKPSNVLVEEDGTPRVLDFGLAKSVAPGVEATLTRSGEFVGSPAWAAPEQVRGGIGAIDTRTDVYALGLLLYLLVSGQHAYPVDGSLLSVIDHVLNTPPTPLRRHGLRRDADLEAVLLRALEKDPVERYASVGALLDDVRRLRRGSSVVARRSAPTRFLRVVRRHPLASTALVLVIGGLATVAGLARRRVAQLEYQRARGTASSVPDLERAHLLSEAELWGAILTDTPYGSSSGAGSFPGALPFLWALRNYYQRVPVVGRKLVRNARNGHFHPTRDECLFFSRKVLVGAFRLPDLVPFDPELEPLARSIMFSPGGTSRLVREDGQLTLEREGRPPWVVPVEPSSLRGYRFVDDDRLALLEGGSILVWDIDRRELTLDRPYEGGKLIPAFGELAVRAGRELRFPDSARPSLHTRGLSVSTSGGIVVNRLEDGVYVWDGRNAPVLAADSPGQAVASNDGRWLALEDGNRLQLVELRHDEAPVERLLLGHTRPIRGLRWSGSSRYLVTWDDVGELLVWEPDLAWSRRLVELGEGMSRATHASVVREGRVAAVGNVGAVAWAWVVEDEEVTHSFQLADKLPGAAPDEAPRFSGVTFLDRDALVFTGMGGLWRWDLDRDEPPRCVFRVPHAASINHVAASPDGGRLAIADDDGVVRVFARDALLASDAAEPSVVVDDPTGERLSWIAWAPDGQSLVAARPTGGFLLVAPGRGACRSFEGPQLTPARCVEFNPKLPFFVSGDDHGALRFWDTSGRYLNELRSAHGGRIYALAFDPSGRLLCTGDSVGRVRVWYVDELPDGRPESLPVPIFSFDTGNTQVFDVELVDRDRILTAGGPGGVVLWDFAALDRYVAGNLEHWVRRLDAVAAPGAVRRLRVWKGDVEARAGR